MAVARRYGDDSSTDYAERKPGPRAAAAASGGRGTNGVLVDSEQRVVRVRSFLDLDPDTCHRVLSFLPPKDLAQVRRVSSVGAARASDDALWLQHIARTFNEEPAVLSALASRARRAQGTAVAQQHAARQPPGKAGGMHRGYYGATASTTALLATPHATAYGQGRATEHEQLRRPTTPRHMSLVLHHFIDRWQSVQLNRRSLARSNARAAAVRVAGRRRKRLHYVFECCQVPCLVGLPVPLVLAFLVLLAVKLDGAPDMSYWEVFAPVWALVAVVAGAFVCACGAAAALKCARDRGDEDVSVFRYTDGQHSGIAYVASSAVAGGTRQSVCHLAGTCTLFIACPVLLCLKMEGTVDMPWGVALLPVWILLFWQLLGPACWRHSDSRDVAEAAAGFTVSFVVFVMPVLIMAAVNGDGTHVATKYILIPFEIIDVSMVLGACGVCMMGIRHGGGNRDERLAIGGGCAAFILVVGPVIAFEVMLAVRGDGGLQSMTYVQLFAPLFVFVGWLALASLAAAGALCVGGTFSGRRLARWLQHRHLPHGHPGRTRDPAIDDMV